MKNSTITLLGILLSIMLFIGILLAGFTGFMYFGAKMWERGWVKVDSITGPDGYTYCIFHETGIGQDPYTKLIRTKDPENEDSYEDLGEVNECSSRLTVIRPVDIAKGKETRLYLKSNNLVFAVSYNNTTPFIYDIAKHQFYAGGNNKMSPFILIEKENIELYKQDYVPVILRFLEDYALHTSHTWPSQETLKNGLSHPNKEVQKVSRWLMEIQEHGLSYDSETMRELIDFLIENLSSKDFITQLSIIKALGFFQNSYIDKAIPLLEAIRLSDDMFLNEEAAISLRKIKK